jgi:hypothetical protein
VKSLRSASCSAWVAAAVAHWTNSQAASLSWQPALMLAAQEVFAWRASMGGIAKLMLSETGIVPLTMSGPRSCVGVHRDTR